MTSVGRAGPPGFDLHGRLAVVTGARRGLGLAIAKALASAARTCDYSEATVQVEAGGTRSALRGHVVAPVMQLTRTFITLPPRARLSKAPGASASAAVVDTSASTGMTPCTKSSTAAVKSERS